MCVCVCVCVCVCKIIRMIKCNSSEKSYMCTGVENPPPAPIKITLSARDYPNVNKIDSWRIITLMDKSNDAII